MAAKSIHSALYRSLRHTVGWILRAIFRFEGEIVQPEAGPCLVLANHNTDLDPALIALSFPKHMYFVASEHVFRKGFASWALTTFFAPISRIKGATDAQAALDIMRTLRRGDNVCLFAEGNRSFSGVTGPIFPATGKLARASGAALVTYRFTGGYLTTPRWSHTLRKGKMTGSLVHLYTSEALRAMKPDEINAHIAEDLYEDAFARQQADPIAFRGKALAEGLERAIFICPKCGQIGALRGRDDHFTCACGLDVRYTEYGFFEGNDAPFSCVRDWDEWQNGALERLAAEGLAVSDADMELVEVSRRHRQRAADQGALHMDQNALTLGQTILPLASISSMALIGAQRLVLSAGDRHYEIRAGKNGYCGRKYFLLYQIYRKKG